jgi:phage FluMu protein Com
MPKKTTAPATAVIDKIYEKSSPTYVRSDNRSDNNASRRKCDRHVQSCGQVVWESSTSSNCPVCDMENELELQNEALDLATKRLEQLSNEP